MCMLFSYTSVLIHVSTQLWISVYTNSYVHSCMGTLIKETVNYLTFCYCGQKYYLELAP